MNSRDIEYDISIQDVEDIKEMWITLRKCYRSGYDGNDKVRMVYRKTFCKKIWPRWNNIVKEHKSIGECEIARIYTDFFSTTYHLFKLSDRDYYL